MVEVRGEAVRTVGAGGGTSLWAAPSPGGGAATAVPSRGG